MSLVSGVTPCTHSTLMRRKMATTLLTRGGEAPRWMNSSEAQSWVDRYFTAPHAVLIQSVRVLKLSLENTWCHLTYMHIYLNACE